MSITGAFRPVAGSALSRKSLKRPHSRPVSATTDRRSRGRGVRSGADSNRRPCGLSRQEITEPLRPATVLLTDPPGVEPGLPRLELGVLSVTPQVYESGRPGSNGPLRSGAPVLFPMSYVREIRPAGFEPASSALARRRSGPLSYERTQRGFEAHCSWSTELRGADGGGRTRTCERCDRLRASNALPFQLGHASMKEEGEGVEPPRPRDPPVFETGYRTDGSPSMSDSGRARTCASPGKSRELYRLSYGAMSNHVAGRDRTCDAPRFRRALYRLSFSHQTFKVSDRPRALRPCMRSVFDPRGCRSPLGDRQPA